MDGETAGGSRTDEALTAEQLFAGLGSAGASLRTHDWTATPLGPVATWPHQLITAVRTLLPSRLPMLIWWGPELTQLYNDAFTRLMGDKHPLGLGEPAAKSWAEIWNEIGPMADAVLNGEGAVFAEDKLFFLDRHGYLEETYWTFSYSPIEGPERAALGVFVAATEVTERVIWEHRLRTIHALATMPVSELPTPQDACQAATETMAGNRQALPFTACYLLDGDERTLALVASYGVRPGSALCPSSLALDDHTMPSRVGREGKSELLTDLGSLTRPGDLEPSSLAGSLPECAMVLPLRVGGHSRPKGVLVLGVNPHRAINDAYLAFFDLVSRQISTLLTDAFASQELRHRATSLADLDNARSRFFQNVSHEFRTPLTLIIAALGPGPLDPKRPHGDLSVARAAAWRLDRLVEALLTFAQAEVGELRPRSVPSDIAILTRDLSSMFRSAIQNAGLALTVEVPGLGVEAMVDPDMWVAILTNLLSNAVKFTRSGTIGVVLRASKTEIALVVSDTGMGIPEQDLDSIFERFHQVQEASVDARGSGIGLALVADLVSAHGGVVKVKSAPGSGSAFTVTLPRVMPSGDIRKDGNPEALTSRPDLLAMTTQAPATTPLAVAPPDPSTVNPDPMYRGRVLVVEDDGDLRAYISSLLSPEGWEVVELAAAEGALEVDPPPDLILSDIMLPGADGLELVRRVRADPKLSRLPVLLLTARAGPGSAADGLAAGADDYIVKPFSERELLARVRVHHELSVLREKAVTTAEDEVANLHTALRSNRRIGAATGIVMAQCKVTEDRAFALLRTASNQNNRKLVEVADEVLRIGSLDARL